MANEIRIDSFAVFFPFLFIFFFREPFEYVEITHSPRIALQFIIRLFHIEILVEFLVDKQI